MDDFMPHGMCLLWNPALLSIFVIGNTLVAAAYFSIPLSLCLLVRKRKDLSFKGLYALFGAFIVFCGTTHILKIYTIWHATYWLEASVDLLTGLISVVTAILMWRLLPNILTAAAPSLQLFQRKFDLMPQLGWTAAADGSVDFYNKNYYDYTGKTFEELRNDGWRQVQDPDTLPEVEGRWRKSLAESIPFEMELRMRRHDGDLRWFLSRVNPMYDDEGKIVRWVGVSTDIHNQKVAEVLLQERQKQLESMAEAVPLLVWTADANGEIDYHNRRWYEYTGLPDEHTRVSVEWSQVLHPDDLEGCLEKWNEAFTSGDTFEVRVRFKRASDGAYRWHLVRAVAHKNLDGQAIKWFGSCTDVHDQKEAEEALEKRVMERTEQLESLAAELARSNRDLQQFAYAASHDLQEPLRTIISFCDLLKKKVSGKLDPDADKYLTVIGEGTSRMQQLIKDLLGYASVDAQGKPLEPIKLSQPVNMALDSLRAAIGDSGASVVCDELPVVLGDATQLSLLFQNLIGNAIKFRSEAPLVVRIAVERVGDFYEVSIKDNGIGFKMEYAERIFVIFQRLHARSKFEGTGIGLATCKRIIERHGGTIRVDSIPGEGSTFIITLQAGGNNDKSV